MKITSVNNELVKETSKLLQKKYRNLIGKFILEGFKPIEEAFNSGITLERVFVEKSHLEEFKFLDCEIIITNEIVLKKLSETDNAPVAVAVGYMKKYSTEVLKSLNKVVLLEGIKDLGNLGTIIRSSVAFGAEAIILYGDCADMYNPKCVRSSVGNLWKIPIFYIKNFNELEKYFSKFTKIATLPKSDNMLKNYKVKLPAIIMFGSEANGLSQELIDFSTDSLKIEMTKEVESLNLAVSVSIVLYNIFE